MKTKSESLRDEIARVLAEQAPVSPSQAVVFPAELIARILDCVHELRQQGRSLGQCAAELGLSRNRLHYWLYQRQRHAPTTPPAALRPVQVSSQLVPVYDGVPERRYTLRSPAGWELRELTLPELVELLRSLL